MNVSYDEKDNKISNIKIVYADPTINCDYEYKQKERERQMIVSHRLEDYYYPQRRAKLTNNQEHPI